MKTTLQHPNSAGPTKNKHGHLSATKNEATGKSLPSQQVVVQPELELTQPGDSYEQEADSMADFVMRMPSADHRGLPRSHSSVTSAFPPTISRQANSGSGVAVDKCTADGILASQGGGHTLPDGLRSRMEDGFGCDFSAVRLHTDSHAAELCTSLQAKAFTYGNDIYFNQGRYNPHSAAGQHLIAHELTHTLQQSGKIGRQQEDEEIENLRKYFNENFAHIEQYRKGKVPDVRFLSDRTKYGSGTIKEEGKKKKVKLIDCDVYAYEAISHLADISREDLQMQTYDPRFEKYRYHMEQRVAKVTYDGKKEVPREIFDPDKDTKETRKTIGKLLHERFAQYQTQPISLARKGNTNSQIVFYPIGFEKHLAMIFKLNEKWYLLDNGTVERVGIVEGGAGKPQDISNALKRIQELHNYVFKYYYFMGVKYNMPASLLKKNP